MPRNLSPGATMLTMTLLLAMGCADSGDERFRQLAQQALYEQSEQNKRLAEQSKQIAEASRRLVEGDAAARKDLLAARKQLTSELHSERADLDRQREDTGRVPSVRRVRSGAGVESDPCDCNSTESGRRFW